MSLPMCMAPGYWSGPQLVTDMAALVRVEDEGRSIRTWMSMTPMEIESQELGCRAASGHTVVMGLGMGWATANAALRPDVTAVTVVEFDPEVIAMIGEIGVFEQLRRRFRSKITVVRGDALTYTPDQPADTLLADIWLPINGDGRVDQVRAMRANTGASRVYFWGQEMVIARMARASGPVAGARRRGTGQRGADCRGTGVAADRAGTAGLSGAGGAGRRQVAA